MKKIIFIFLVILFLQSKAQNNVSVEKSATSFQIGTVGIWLNNEARLSDEFALRTEVGLYTDIEKGVGFFMAPEITLEPRWYYNLKKRSSNKLDIRNNAANFFTVKTSLRSSLFEISTFDDNLDRAENSISFIPKWGIRRNIGKNFNFEAGLGVGYIHFINQKYYRTFDNNGIAIDLHFRIGYNF